MCLSKRQTAYWISACLVGSERCIRGRGIPIGYVTKIENNSNNLTKSGTITPVVDFEHIENVMVITQLKQTGDTKTADDTESTETAGDSQTENSTENK